MGLAGAASVGLKGGFLGVLLFGCAQRARRSARRRLKKTARCGVPISPQNRGAADQLGDIARAENWRNPESLLGMVNVEKRPDAM